MMTIYLDGSAALEPGAADQLHHLTDAGHRLVLVGPADHRAGPLLSWTDHVGSIPDEPGVDAWFVTTDPAACGDRRPGLRTLLIGPRDPGSRPTRCDASARDLRSAVLELLAGEAMP